MALEIIVEIDTTITDILVETEVPNFTDKTVRQDTDFPYFWIGKAVYGSSDDSPVWFIYRSEMDLSGAIIETLTAANVKWTDRLTITYN